MKKFILGILSFMFLIAGGNLISSAFVSYAEGEQAIINIGSAEEFVRVFTTPSTYNNENIKIVLNSPLDFSNVEFSPISESKNTFTGTLDGNGYSVSNITLTSKSLYYGLIPYAKGATIENLRVTGNVDFVFDSKNIQEIYAGILVGYGENVVIKNCELDNTIINQEDGSISYATINVPVFSNINFGLLAGKIKGNPNANNQTMPANIVNCVNYYDINVVLNKYTNVAFGGLIGNLENGYILNSLNFGKVNYSKLQTLTNINSNAQYFGGLAGTINGSGLNIRNSCFGGEIKSYEDVAGVNAVVGAIFGGATSNQPSTINVNFDYYTQSALKPSGDDFVTASNKLSVVSAINKNLLQTAESFDQSVPSFDFDMTWILSNSRFHIQDFQQFEYSFSNVLDRNQVLENAMFCTTGSQNGSEGFNARYGTQIDIRIKIKSKYQGFYTFSSMLLNNNQFTGSYEIQEIGDENKVEGYIISISANATTAGTYSFVISQKTYDCVISVSDEAKELSQGGVRVQSSSIESTPSPEFHITFAYNSAAKSVIAEGNGIYSFDHWELLYRDENGDFSGEKVSFDESGSNPLKITFGEDELFNREFKLVAYFTDEEAIKLDFGSLEDTFIKSINVGGVDYAGEPIQIPPTKNVQIEVITKADYLIDITAIENLITELYGDSTSPYPVQAKEASKNEQGETTYVFNLDLKSAKNNIKNNVLSIDLKVEKDTSNDGNNLLWLYITLPIVAVIAIGLIIFFVIRHKNGGGKSGGTKAPKEKKTSYKDYYI